MFIIGLELDIHLLKHKAHTAVVVSHASIIIPFAMGVSLAYFLYEKFAPPQISFLALWLVYGHRHEHYRVPGAGSHPA